MPGPDATQRLAAILAADAAGYTRLMHDDESATMATLDEYRGIFRQHIEANRGRLVDTAGDSVLAVFEIASGAVGAALAIQHDIGGRNEGMPEDRRMHFRIGIHLGDVMEKTDGSVFGDGVNVAARLEGIAEPGTIAASEIVQGAVEDRLDVAFVSLGEHEVKNIEKPVSAYRVVTGGDTVTVKPRKLGARKIGVAAAAAAVIGLGVLAVWHYSGGGLEGTQVALALPDKPSIAVLPFSNLSDDAAQEYFADGLTEDLITDLSKIQGLFVIARNSSFTYKGKPTKVQTVAADLGVQYVLEGSVRRTGDAVRINAQLIDALTGRHLWAERYEGEFADIFELQDKVLEQTITNLAIVLTDAEAPIAGETETDVVEAYDTFLLGWEYYHRGTPDANLEAISLFERAIELDPGYSRAYAGLAAAYWDRISQNWEQTHGFDWDRTLKKAIASLEKAQTTPTSETYRLAAEILSTQGRHGEAVAQIDRALALDPNSPDSYVSKARILNAIGRAEEAEQSVRTAMRLDPHYRPNYLRVLALARFNQMQYVDAAVLLERVIGQGSKNPRDYVTLTAAYGHLGRREEAEAARKTYDDIVAAVGYTPMNIQEMGVWWYGDSFSYHPAYTQALQDGLGKAGVPEGSGEPDRFAEYRELLRRDINGLYEVQGSTKIDAAQAKALYDSGEAVFVDVRAAGMFASGHIPGAVNLDLNMGLTEEDLSEVVGKDDAVVLSCVGSFCPVSAWACAKALTWGFTNVYYFPGAAPAWDAAGYPMETSNLSD